MGIVQYLDYHCRYWNISNQANAPKLSANIAFKLINKAKTLRKTTLQTNSNPSVKNSEETMDKKDTSEEIKPTIDSSTVLNESSGGQKEDSVHTERFRAVSTINHTLKKDIE